jgi:putative transposase
MSEKQSVRVKIRRLYVAEAIYFITAVTLQRQPIFANTAEIERLRETMRAVKEIHPFNMIAFVFLPDHFHLLIRVSPDTDISQIMHSIKRNFTLNYKRAHAITDKLTLWQHGFWDHVLRNEQDFVNHLHYIHYNAVKHGRVTTPEAYPHSSYMEYVNREWYDIGWGHIEPPEIQHITE